MKVIIGCDFAGFELKQEVQRYLSENKKVELIDIGMTSLENDIPYYEIGAIAARKLQAGEAERGILFCGTGMGVSISANKFKGVYASVVESEFTGPRCKIINNSNIISMGGWVVSQYRAKKVGFIFQFASLLPVLTARENLQLPTIFGRNGSKPRDNMAEEYLDMVGLKDKIDAYPSQLSGGQQRRVAIARSLINDPEVILGDEPTGDLDEETEMEIMDLLKRVNRQNSITIILVTHNSELARTASKQFEMSHGSLKEI